MYEFALLFLIGLPIFITLDLLWVGVVAQSFYHDRLASLLGDVNWLAAVAFYVIFVFGLTFFATHPAATAHSLGKAALLGALFGLCTYATYDLVNMATLKVWPLSVTIVDIAWGTALGAMVSVLVLLAYRLVS